MFISALRTLTTALVMAIYVVALAPPLLLWRALTRHSRPLYAAADFALRLGFALLGIRLRIAGAEHIRPHQAAVYVANHISNLDPPALYRTLSGVQPRVRTLYKAELRRVPLLGRVFDVAGFVPVERQRRGRRVEAFESAARALVGGHSFFVFPEGTRSRTGALLPFKQGAFRMAIAAQAPVIPTILAGGSEAMRKGSWIIRPVTVAIEFCPPIETHGLAETDREALIQRVRAAIARGDPATPGQRSTMNVN